MNPWVALSCPALRSTRAFAFAWEARPEGARPPRTAPGATENIIEIVKARSGRNGTEVTL